MKARNLGVRSLATCSHPVHGRSVSSVAQSSNPVLPDPGQPGMNRQQQEQLGLQAAGEVYQQMPVLPDSSPATRYVQELGKKLPAVIPCGSLLALPVSRGARRGYQRLRSTRRSDLCEPWHHTGRG